MKRSLALLLTSLLLVFSLAACGKDQQPGGVDGAGSVNGSGDVNGTGTANGSGDVNGTGTANGSGDSGLTGSHGAGGTMMDGALDTMENAGDAARSVVRDTGDALTGGSTGQTRNQMNGYTYDRMVQNGRVF